MVDVLRNTRKTERCATSSWFAMAVRAAPIALRVESRGGRWLFAAVVALSLTAVGCMPTHAKPAPRLFTPPPIQPKPVASAVPELEAGPALKYTGPPNPQEIVTLEMPQFPAPPKAAAPRPSPSKPSPTPLPPSPPRITQLFTAEQLREYNEAYDRSQDNVRKALTILQSKNLSRAQRSAVDRIRTFQMQAEQEHDRDLVTAVNLARRADVLSADLLRRLP